MEVVPSVTVLDLKIQLPFLKNHSRRIVDGIRNAEGNRAVMDAGVAAYLLNPLKDTYGYDDLARDYLDMTVPSQVDLLGKTALSDAFETMPEKALNCVCYMAYTAWKSREILLGRLRRHGMLHLFYEIEMPVIYSLYHMEEEGIQVRREELKAYGERLQTQVEKLEQEIYAETGCEFNINSPKQLGEVYLKKPSGRQKTKTGYSTAADVLENWRLYPVVRKDDYRQVAKLKSTYADGWGIYPGGRNL
ncbi:MAG: DNA polymerase [Clostridium fessum]